MPRASSAAGSCAVGERRAERDPLDVVPVQVGQHDVTVERAGQRPRSGTSWRDAAGRSRHPGRRRRHRRGRPIGRGGPGHDESRRAIERDLHDGAQQHLVALAVRIGLAKAVAAADPDGLPDQLRVDVQAAIGAVRELAHGIYPPLVRERGPGEALRQQPPGRD